jgi:Big-like domain-containing protein
MPRIRSIFVYAGSVLLLTAAIAPAIPGADSGRKRALTLSVAPLVSVTAPSDGASFMERTPITVAANASDADGIRSVEFFAGSTRIGDTSRVPYSVTWGRPTPGEYALTAVATDNVGARTTSAPVRIVVKRDQPPTVSLTAPNAGSTFTAPATIPLAANAADADGSVRRVYFFAKTATLPIFLGESKTPPYGATWNNVAVGHYEIGAIAIDNLGRQTKSALVAIDVTPDAPPPPPPPDPTTEPLVQEANLAYEGAFRLPAGFFVGSTLTQWEADRATFDFGGTALAFNAQNNSLFLVGYDEAQLTAEVDIPAAVDVSAQPTPSIDSLLTATVRQPFADVTDGLRDTVHPSGTAKKIGGLLPYNGQLYATAYESYDAFFPQQIVSHFVSPLDLNVTGDVRGPFQVGGTLGIQGFTGFIDGYFGLVPSEWQPLLGGPVLNGNCCLSIITRTSYGPAVSTIDPAQLGSVDPLPANPLLYYPQDHHTLGDWNVTSQYFGDAQAKGIVFPKGSRSVLFFGWKGTGPFCYDDGPAAPLCTDPVWPYKGAHAFPYVYFVWAYDANDLAKVKSGLLNPWDVVPYAGWSLTLPFSGDAMQRIEGATYDPATNRIYVTQAHGDGDRPLVHVFSVHLP